MQAGTERREAKKQRAVEDAPWAQRCMEGPPTHTTPAHSHTHTNTWNVLSAASVPSPKVHHRMSSSVGHQWTAALWRVQ